MFISRKRLERLERDVDWLGKQLDLVRSFLNIDRDGGRYCSDQATVRDLYDAFERTHTRKAGVRAHWVAGV